MITSHLHSFLNDRNIPFFSLPFGVSIERKYYDNNIFKNFDCCFLDATFIIKYPEPKKIDYRKYIEPKKQIFVTENGLTTALLVNI